MGRDGDIESRVPSRARSGHRRHRELSTHCRGRYDTSSPLASKLTQAWLTLVRTWLAVEVDVTANLVNFWRSPSLLPAHEPDPAV